MERKEAEEDADWSSLDQELAVELVHLPAPSNNQEGLTTKTGKDVVFLLAIKEIGSSLGCSRVAQGNVGREQMVNMGEVRG
jgi:hypothetical protein